MAVQMFSKNVLEGVSIECRKSKTKVITLANQKGRRQSSKPINTRRNYTQQTQSAGKCARASHDIGFAFNSDWLKKWRERSWSQSLSEVMENQSNSLITFDTQLKTTLIQELKR